jgi:hypothetical protein
MAEIKKINNYDIKDETARNAIDEINNKIPEGVIATEQYVNDAIGNINTILDNINGEVL